METFILGFKYVKKERFKCQVIHFLLGQAKMAIYVSHKKKIEQMCSDDIGMDFLNSCEVSYLNRFSLL